RLLLTVQAIAAVTRRGSCCSISTSGIDVPQPTNATAGAVVGAVNSPRTQNGHIRNDTGDASRRIWTAFSSPSCRRKCAANDRACTRVTLQNLHGKEGVSGSSPEEGSAKAPHNGAFCLGSRGVQILDRVGREAAGTAVASASPSVRGRPCLCQACTSS